MRCDKFSQIATTVIHHYTTHCTVFDSAWHLRVHCDQLQSLLSKCVSQKVWTTFARQSPPMYKPITSFAENATEVVTVSDSRNSAVWFPNKICSRGLYCDFCWFGFQIYTTFNLNFKASYLPWVLVSIDFGALRVVFFPVGFGVSVREGRRKQFAGRTCLPSHVV